MERTTTKKILAIETSCDDTCISIVEVKSQKSKVKIDVLSNVVSSQVKIHAKYGGVYPTLAKREHQRNLVPILQRVLSETRLLKSKISARGGSDFGGKNQKSKIQIKNQKIKEVLEREEVLFKQLKRFLAKYQKPKIDAIAVTVGPGLEPCLWVGVNFAKSLACFWDLPIVPVNHIEAHIFANFVSSNSKIPPQRGEARSMKLNGENKNSKLLFPAICLVVSGGHTQLILMKDFGKYKIIGGTRDDAAGECFDKAARILGLGYPGGPIVAKMATKIKNQNAKIKITLPRPMIYQKNYDFSFSGLKTAVLYLVKQLTMNNKQLTIKQKRGICAETQQAIIDVLIHKTLKAAQDFKAKSIILGGGVTANSELRKQFGQKIKTLKPEPHLFIPAQNLSTDNAAMVGTLAYYWQKRKTKKWQKIEAMANLSIN